MGTTIGIGMIGAGGIAKGRHLPNLQKIEEVKLVAVANKSQENAEQVARHYEFKRVYARWQDVITDAEVDAVFICTPPYMHSEMTSYALAQGKHVFCQARMAMDLADALQMLEEDRQSPLTTMLCPAPLYLEVEPVVQEYLQAGQLGELRHIVIHHAGSMFADPEQSLHWRQRQDLQGINMLDVGLVAELMNKWFGPVEALQAIGHTWVTERKEDQDGHHMVELPDSVTVIGHFRQKAMLTALFTNAVIGGSSELTIYGSKGRMTCYLGRPYISLQLGEKEERVDIPLEKQGKWRVEEDFIKAIKAGKKGYPSFEDGSRYMAFTQAVMDSIQSGERKKVASV